MTASGPKSLPAIGFLTVVEHAQHGLFGGYLVINVSGRPLEFHCTAPVKPNRAQEILYGPTLRPYLFGEQIGYALVSKAKLQPLWLCTDRKPVLALRDLVKFPVALVAAAAESVGFARDETPGVESRDEIRAGGQTARTPDDLADLVEFPLGKYRAWVTPGHQPDRQTVLDSWQEHAESLDLLEPFDRIRDALEEAQRVAA